MHLQQLTAKAQRNLSFVFEREMVKEKKG